MTEFSLSNLPTLFRGVWWDDGWEFDGPCAIYTAIRRIGNGGNYSAFDLMVEDICIDISLGKSFSSEWSDVDRYEMEWRGWSPRGFSKRKKAWHLEATVNWFGLESGEPRFDFSVQRQWGPFTSIQEVKRNGLDELQRLSEEFDLP